ncbi:transcription termination factor Rho [Candidatus Poribacteria bacterium]|nr:transcription termination factor Rho [Candidatus Poribacteria bacterium]
MEELKSLILRAQGGDVDAFGTIVQRFQDMAVGYAYSILGDFHLAEDAAQEAFIAVYRDLSTLRAPAAFPSWLKKLVFKQCNRLTRGKSVELLPLETAFEIPSTENDPMEAMAEREMKDNVLAAIQALPENERVVTTLFYINGYSHQEIADFLEIPATTVNHRLRASRKRLKERMITMAQDTFHENRPSRNNEFVKKLIYPNRRFKLEHYPNEMFTRILDLLVPIGKGQRGFIVAPPYSGKRNLLRNIATGIATNHPEVELLILLVGARPEEITETKQWGTGKVIGLTYEETPGRQIQVAEAVIEESRQVAESGRDVVVLLDSMTHLIRAYNVVISSGQTTGDDFDVSSLEPVKKLLQQVGNLEQSGSLAVIATLLVGTGNPVDERIYEALKGTGNLEIHLDSTLVHKGIFPAIDLFRSRTRREDLLLTASELNVVKTLREAIMADGEPSQAMELLLAKLGKSHNNAEFLDSIKNQKVQTG